MSGRGGRPAAAPTTRGADRPGDGEAPLLAIRDLRIRFDGREQAAVDGVSLEVGDEVLAVVGESGSGKSVTAMSVLGLLPDGAAVEGSIRFRGEELLGADGDARRKIRGAGAAMVFQDPSTALDPVFSVGAQIVEAVRARRRIPRREARERALDLLRSVDMPDPEKRMSFYPHQLSGGQAQRVVLAIALAGEPSLLIADEPTTALDVTVQAEVLEVVRALRQRLGTSILLITHDMGVVADIAERVVVMRHGRVVETGPTDDLFARPTQPYTRELLASVPRIGVVEPGERGAHGDVEVAAPALEVDGLVVELGDRVRGRVRAVRGVTLTIAKGETLGLVGESGSGKTTLGQSIIGLAPITGGSVRVDGVDVATARGKDLATLRKRVGVVFQNPAGSLNPRFTISRSVAEPLRLHAGLRGPGLDGRVRELLDAVGLGGQDFADRYPHELSGGQRQRVAIARAVALDPELLIADEPTSALDVSVQARVLDLLRGLQQRFGFACLFISHDLAVVDALCSRVAVLHHGDLVELGDRASVLASPEAQYTRDLLAAAPVADPAEQRRRREERLRA